MTAIETMEKNGYTARVFYDEEPSSPAEWCNIGTIAYNHSRGSFGELPMYWQDYGTLEDSLPDDAIVALPLYTYDGYGDTEITIADDWGSANGWIYATGKCSCGSGAEMTENMTREQVTAALKSEIKTWNQWAQGDVYGYAVENPEGDHVDSCGGFYGLEYAIEEARTALENSIEWEYQQDRKISEMMRL